MRHPPFSFMQMCIFSAKFPFTTDGENDIISVFAVNGNASRLSVKRAAW